MKDRKQENKNLQDFYLLVITIDVDVDDDSLVMFDLNESHLYNFEIHDDMLMNLCFVVEYDYVDSVSFDDDDCFDCDYDGNIDRNSMMNSTVRTKIILRFNIGKKQFI